MTSTRLSVSALTFAVGLVGCSGVSGGGPMMGGSGGTGDVGGTGGSGGGDASLSVSLKASLSVVTPGDVIELTWTAENATSCEAGGGWSGDKSTDGDSQDVEVFRETTYSITCEDASGDEVTSSVTVTVSGRLLATLQVTPNPAKGGERALATVTVSNPSDEPVDDVEVSLKIPDDHVEDLSADDYSPGGVCSDPSACGAGDTITWFIGTLEVGEVVTLFLFPTISESIPPGTPLDFELTVNATDEPMSRTVATTQQGERTLALSMEQGSSKAQAGDEVDYSLHYTNATDGLLEDVVILMVLPLSTTLQSASEGAAMMDGQTIQWTFVELEPGQGGTLKANVVVDEGLPEGAQLFATAEGEADGKKTLATTTTSVSDDELIATTQVSPDRLKAGDTMRVDVTASNRGLATMQDVEIAVRVPEGLERVYDSLLSEGGDCPGSYCTAGTLATWDIGDIASGDSVTVSLFPVAASDLLDVVPFEALISIAGELAVQTSTAAVHADRVLELRLTESDNPVEPGQKLAYVLDVGNQSDTAVNGALTARVPNGTSFLGASDGGTVDANGIVTWPLTQLQAGTGTARQFEVEVGSDVPLGNQLRAEATAMVTGSSDDAQATKHTPVGTTALKASVEVNPDPTKRSERMLVNVTVSNPGSTPANDVVVDLRTPSHLERLYDTELSANGDCLIGAYCTAGSVARWTLGTIEAGASTTITLPPVIDAAAPDATLVSFDTEVRATGEVPVYASGTTIVDDARPLELQLSQSQNPVQPGSLLIYTLHFGNQSGVTLNGTLSLNVPAGAGFSAASGDGDFDAETSLVTWDLTQLGLGQGGTRELAVEVDDDLAAGSQLRASASAIVGTDAGDRASATAMVPVSQAELIASVDVVSDPVNAGQAGLVSVVVSNPGAVFVNDITVDVRIPAYLERLYDEQLSAGGDCPGTYCIEGYRASWAVGTLGPGESTTLWFPPLVNASTPDGTLLPFQAEVNATDEPPLIAKAATVVDDGKPLDLRIDEGGYPVSPGAVLDYTVHFANQSGRTLSGLLAVVLPEGTSFFSASDGGTHDRGVVGWPIDLLPADGTGSRTVSVEVAGDEPQGSQLEAFATAAIGNGDGDRVRATEHTPVADSPVAVDAMIDSVGAPDAAEPGEQITVSVSVENTTVDAVTDVVVDVLIPQGLDRVYDTDLSAGGECPGSFCSALTRALWNVGNLPGGGSTTVSFVATIANATLPGTLLPFPVEVTSGPEPLAGASATVSVCLGAGCPPP